LKHAGNKSSFARGSGGYLPGERLPDKEGLAHGLVSRPAARCGDHVGGRPGAREVTGVPPPQGDPKGAGGRNVLVVSTVEHPASALRHLVGSDDAIKVVVPVVRQGILDLLANDERAFTHAQAVAEQAGAELPGETMDTGAGEADLELAVRDALATFPADEIIVAVHDEADQGLVESIANGDTPKRRSLDGVPIRCIVVRG
jgi:hypothetical protein